MSAFDLDASLARARSRLADAPRRPRSDRGQRRVDPAIIAALTTLTSGQDRPPMAELLADLAVTCREEGLRPASRATVYTLLTALTPHSYRVGALPAAAQTALHNLEPDSVAPGRQVAFYCLNYGGLEAISFAAAMPWLSLYQAARMRGWRKKSRGLLDAILRVRRI